MKPEKIRITSLGACTQPSPLNLNAIAGDVIGNFVSDDAWIRYNIAIDDITSKPELLFERAGPRARIFFKPEATRVAIVTCGGLCPGLNNVIRSAYRELCAYGVREVWGIRYGYLGLNAASGLTPMRLTDDVVEDIHKEGGTILGSSRGNQPVPAMVDYLQQHDIRVLITIGGDGTQRGACAISAEALRRGLPIAVVGVPKTIDNDVQYVQRSFGFTTAVDQARAVLACAHNEAHDYPNGIAIVRLMGRDSGFIAAMATVVSQEVNFTLIPEIPFALEGRNGLLEALRQRLARKRHALIVVAEGAGQNLCGDHVQRRDASGNIIHADIGIYLRDRITAYFKEQGIAIAMKYIDPSYIIRSSPAGAEDAALCDHYARCAVHAAMAGKTEVLISYWNAFVHVPLAMATEQRQRVSPDSQLWNSVLSATQQPPVMC
jgi:6-phosphofructokinase 1